MNTNTVALFPTSATTANAAPRRLPRPTLLQRIHARFWDGFSGWRERARARRMDRLTAAALAHLGPHELRDIGLVRLNDITPARYLRIYDFV